MPTSPLPAGSLLLQHLCDSVAPHHSQGLLQGTEEECDEESAFGAVRGGRCSGGGGAGGGAGGGRRRDGKLDPDKVTLIFVHGGSGSAAQFESQQMRMTSNGFPQRYIHVLEYDTLSSLDDTIDEVHANLDALIERVKAQTGKPKVDVLGHSRGTTVMHEYLASPERGERAPLRQHRRPHERLAAGRSGTLAIWAGVRTWTRVRSRRGDRRGAERHDPEPDPRSGRDLGGVVHPDLQVPGRQEARHRRDREGQAQGQDRRPGGRFPLNVGVPAGTELDVWRLKPGTGERKGKAPVAEPALAANGSWGPLKLRRGKRYEFALNRPDGVVHHLYPEPFRHNDRLVRLLSSVTGEGVELLLEPNDANSGMVIVRTKEFWGDHGGGQSDVLTVEGQNVVTPAVSPISSTTNAVFVFDDDSDGMSDLSEPNQLIASLPFLTHADLFIPAAEPPNDTVEVSLRSRGRGPTRA